MDQIKKDNKRSFGSLGEELACRYLTANGCRIAEKNYRAGKMGEIDIIAFDGEYICFVEVKTRTGNLFGTPGESVGRRKQENLRKLAWTYLKLHGLTEKPVRFDIAEVTGRKRDGCFLPENINLIKNAF